MICTLQGNGSSALEEPNASNGQEDGGRAVSPEEALRELNAARAELWRKARMLVPLLWGAPGGLVPYYMLGWRSWPGILGAAAGAAAVGVTLLFVGTRPSHRLPRGPWGLVMFLVWAVGLVLLFRWTGPFGWFGSAVTVIGGFAILSLAARAPEPGEPVWFPRIDRPAKIRLLVICLVGAVLIGWLLWLNFSQV